MQIRMWPHGWKKSGIRDGQEETMRKRMLFLLIGSVSLLLFGCSSPRYARAQEDSSAPEQSADAVVSPEQGTDLPAPSENGAHSSAASDVSQETDSQVQTGLIAEQILEGETGTIHYSYYLPEGYSDETEYPMVVTMPGYDMMWFGEQSSGANLNWEGFLCWTRLPEDFIVVSAQLTDWRETSANQAIELTEYFLEHFSVDRARVYAAGYFAGGETMSQAVSMRPDLYAAYLHGASQWDGAYEPVAQNGTAVYIFMAEHDEYYGSERARMAYENLYDAYVQAGWTQEDIDSVLQLQTPDDEWFASRGITENYHGGGNVVFKEESVLNWVLSHRKQES